MDPRIVSTARVSLPQPVDPRYLAQPQFYPQPINPQYLQPVSPQIYQTGPVPLNSGKKADMRRVSPRPETAVSVATVDSDIDQPIIKKAAQKRHTRLYTDSDGRVIDVDFKHTDVVKKCPECQGECGSTGVAKTCCWIIWITFFIVIAAGVGGGLGYYYSSMLTAPGGSCTSSSKCVSNAVCTNLVCTCSGSYYVYGQTCASRTLVGQTCTSTTQCVSNAYCNGTCQCLSAYYYDSSLGYCNLKGSYNSLCSQDSQCSTTNSQCYTLSTGRCNCPSGTYYSSSSNACFTLLVQGQTCTDISQCIANAYCTNAVAGTCLCLANYYYSGGACNAVLTVGSICNGTYQCISNSQCVNISGSAVTTCQCNSGYYYDSTTGTCQLTLALGSTCTYTAQCIGNSSCQVAYGMAYSTCQCNSYYYSDLVPASCFPMKYINGACYSSSQCISFASCVSPAVGQPTVCQCNTGFWFNASAVAGGYGACIVKGLPGTNCYDATNCITNSKCTIPAGGTLPKCDCATGYYFSYGSSTCITQLSTGTSCTYDQQCLSNTCNLNTYVCL